MLGKQEIRKKEQKIKKESFIFNRNKKPSCDYYKVETLPALEEKGDYLYCHFCHQRTKVKEARLPNQQYYCPHCISYGRITNQSLLFRCPFPKKRRQQEQIICAWKGNLSPYQKQVAQELITLYQQEKRLVLFAVTGAGKTEMLFPLIEQELKKGRRIAYVSPRVDVIKELYQRFSDAFPMIKIPILYGECHDYFLSEFLVCSIPQCIHFYRAFDLIIVDEADAFPFANNSFLHHMVENACQKEGKILFMTATLNKELAFYPQCHLPLRYHLQPLPVPKFNFLPKNAWKNRYYRKKIKKEIEDAKRRILIFYPSIYQLEKEIEVWKTFFPQLKITSVHSKDVHRGEKVKKFYQQEYDVLLTTMILERGVTFPNIDVWVMHAEHPNFKREVLVQIAGRAGRKKDFAKGKVIFWSEGETIAMQQAKREIIKNNQAGKELQQ